MSEAEVVRWVVAGVSLMLEAAERLGHRDAALVALDASLAAVRSVNDDLLAAKHGKR